MIRYIHTYIPDTEVIHILGDEVQSLPRMHRAIDHTKGGTLKRRGGIGIELSSGLTFHYVLDIFQLHSTVLRLLALGEPLNSRGIERKT